MSDTVGIGVLVSDTGETARTLQHWCDLGILEPLPGTHKQGRGVAREFRASPPLYGERAIALIASRLNRLRIPLATIKDITSLFRRRYFNLFSESPPDEPDLETAVLRALSGSRLEVFAFSFSSGPIIASLIFSMDMQETDDIDEIWGRPDLQVRLPYAMVHDETGYFLNLTKTLKPLRSAK